MLRPVPRRMDDSAAPSRTEAQMDDSLDSFDAELANFGDADCIEGGATIGAQNTCHELEETKRTGKALETIPHVRTAPTKSQKMMSPANTKSSGMSTVASKPSNILHAVAAAVSRSKAPKGGEAKATSPVQHLLSLFTNNKPLNANAIHGKQESAYFRIPTRKKKKKGAVGDSSSSVKPEVGD